MSPRDVIVAFSKAWEAGDFDRALPFIAHDCIYRLYIDPKLAIFAGETVGRPAIEAALRNLRKQFEYLMYRPYNLVEEGRGTVRYSVEFEYRHRATEEVLSGRFRISAYVTPEGLIAECDEYHDRAKVEAFFRLVSHDAAS